MVWSVITAFIDLYGDDKSITVIHVFVLADNIVFFYHYYSFKAIVSNISAWKCLKTNIRQILENSHRPRPLHEVINLWLLLLLWCERTPALECTYFCVQLASYTVVVVTKLYSLFSLFYQTASGKLPLPAGQEWHLVWLACGKNKTDCNQSYEPTNRDAYVWIKVNENLFNCIWIWEI